MSPGAIVSRSTAHLLIIVHRLEREGVALRILDIALDSRAPTGRLLLTMLGAIGEFERALMLERQKEGIAKARAEGKYKGRAPTARAKADQVKALKAQGFNPTQIARKLGIHRASVYRVLAVGGMGNHSATSSFE